VSRGTSAAGRRHRTRSWTTTAMAGADAAARSPSDGALARALRARLSPRRPGTRRATALVVKRALEKAESAPEEVAMAPGLGAGASSSIELARVSHRIRAGS
jgi:hypothetical protein